MPVFVCVKILINYITDNKYINIRNIYIMLF